MDNVDERLMKFHNTLDNWISDHKIDYGATVSDETFKEVCRILHFQSEDIKSLTAMDAQAAIYILSQYLHHMKVIVDREKAVKAWVEQTIGYIISGMAFDKYTKWEEKHHLAVRNHPSGLRLRMLKTTADYRILSGESTIERLNHAIKVLENISRSKTYDRS